MKKQKNNITIIEKIFFFFHSLILKAENIFNFLIEKLNKKKN